MNELKLNLDPHKITLLMAEKQLTRKQLAESAGINPCYIGQMMKHGTVIPTTAGKLASALGVPVAEIIIH